MSHGSATTPRSPRERPARRLGPAAALRRRLGAAPRGACLVALLAALSGCAEKRYYEVSFDGGVQRVDEDGHRIDAPGDRLVTSGGHYPGDGHDHGEEGQKTHPTVVRGAEMPPRILLRGVVELPEELGISAGDYACVFLMAKQDPEQVFSDLVKKIESPAFPLSFEIGTANAMGGHEGVADAGSYEIVARLDRDGDATAEYGDVQGRVARAEVDGEPVTIRLTEVLGGAAAAARPGGPAAAGAGAERPGLTHGHIDLEAAEAELAAAQAGPRVRARVEFAPEYAELDGRYTLWVFVRGANQERGPPIAVRPYRNASFPLDIDLGVEHVPLDVDNKAEMMGGSLRIFARLSLSGATMAQPGDVESEGKLVKAGDEPITLLLDRKRP